MPFKLLLNFLTGELALVNLPSNAPPILPVTGNPIGLLLSLTYTI